MPRLGDGLDIKNLIFQTPGKGVFLLREISEKEKFWVSTEIMVLPNYIVDKFYENKDEKMVKFGNKVLDWYNLWCCL